MKKDEILEKLSALFNFVLSVGIILAIGYFTGVLKGFTVNDFKDAYANLSQGNNVKYTKSNIYEYGGYQPSRIPDAVYRASAKSGNFANILNSNVKAIFFIEGDTQASKSFHYNIQNYLPQVRTKYNVFVYSPTEFKYMLSGNSSAAKICNSLEECNEQRQKAVDHAALVSFFENCGKTMCIINPVKHQYVRLNKYSDAVNMINALQNW